MTKINWTPIHGWTKINWTLIYGWTKINGPGTRECNGNAKKMTFHFIPTFILFHRIKKGVIVKRGSANKGDDYL